MSAAERLPAAIDKGKVALKMADKVAAKAKVVKGDGKKPGKKGKVVLTAKAAAKSEGTFTVFAPNNEAFAAIPSDDLNALLADTAQLKEVILYHVLAAQVLSTELKDGEQKVDTVSGGALWVTKSSSGVTVANYDRSIVANVIAADNMANNGVAHIIDAVLLPPKPMPSLAGLVTSVDDLSTLLTAVGKAGLVDTLSGEGTFTVFAPNNEAFAAIPSDDLNALLADTAQLKEVILYHVLAAQVLSTELKDGEQKVDTVSGGALWVTKSSSGVYCCQLGPLNRCQRDCC